MAVVSGASMFDSEDFDFSQRAAAWQQAIAKFSFDTDGGEVADNFHCSASFVSSPMGMNFARIHSSAQTFTRSSRIKDEALLVLLFLAGDVAVESGLRHWPPTEGDLMLVPPERPLVIRGKTDFRLLLVSVPHIVFGARMFQIKPEALSLTKGDSGFGHVLSQFLGAIAESAERLAPEELRPTDLLLSELLLVAASKEAGTERAAKISNAQSMILRRVCQNIESQLGDANLNLSAVAGREGLSRRYLQKLFESIDDSFSHYVLDRRLSRAREHLENGQFDRFSISEICFMCGFRDAAHFNRSFREKFGQSPKDFRQGVLKTAVDLSQKAVRGWPARAALKNVALKEAAAERPPVSRNSLATETSPRSHYLSATADTVHWGYFSRSLPPVMEVASGDFITIETLTQHAYDDYERMIKGDAGAESVFEWTPAGKRIDRRGAGPQDASIYGRGAGEGFGVHIMTGPIHVRGAMPGDVLEVRLLSIEPRPSKNPAFAGRSFGSNASAWWGFHYKELLSEPKPRETVTIYEIDGNDRPPSARAVYNYRWTPQVDPYGVVHATMDYPGIPVDSARIEKVENFLSGVKIPLRPHFGVIGVAPKEAEMVDSIPPSYFGGNLDNWRVGEGSSVYLPVSVPGALLSIGDPHAAQGDSELSGTAIECSMTGNFQIVLHEKSTAKRKPLQDLSYPLIETPEQWIVIGFSYPNYLVELGAGAQSAVYSQSSLDLAMKDAFRKTRRFLMTNARMSEDEAISFMSIAVDFGISQVVDGNWAVHAILPKAALPRRE